MAGWSVQANARKHCPDPLDLRWGHRAIVAELIQAGQLSERRHGGGEPEHRGRQAFPFYVEVPQLRQADQLPQALLGMPRREVPDIPGPAGPRSRTGHGHRAAVPRPWLNRRRVPAIAGPSAPRSRTDVIAKVVEVDAEAPQARREMSDRGEGARDDAPHAQVADTVRGRPRINSRSTGSLPLPTL